MISTSKLAQRLSLLVLVVFLTSCKSTKTIAAGEVNASLSTKKIISNHYQNELDFKTLSGKLKIDYDDGENSQTVSVSLRMKKGESIWISAPFGVVKAIITQNRVSFYNKLQNEYFDGDFSYLSNLLGTELDFEKVQNLLIGNAVLDLRKEKYNSTIVDGNYGLEPKKMNDLFIILFSLEPRNFKIATQELSQPFEKRFLKMKYQYQDLEAKVLPATIAIEAINKNDITTIGLEYKGMEFGRQLNFPYKIPKGFEEIVLE
jgi:hypothetical protein